MSDVLIHTDHQKNPITKPWPKNAWIHEFMAAFIARTHSWYTVILPGFHFDGFSVPRLAWWFQPPLSGPGLAGAGVHDAWYACRWGTREMADLYAFKRILEAYDVAQWRTGIMYNAVRIGGKGSWDSEQLQDIRNRKFVKFVPIGDIILLNKMVRRGELMEKIQYEIWKTKNEKNKEILYHDLRSIANGDIDNLL